MSPFGLSNGLSLRESPWDPALTYRALTDPTAVGFFTAPHSQPRGPQEYNDHPIPHDRRRTNNGAAGVSPRPRSRVKPRPRRCCLAGAVKNLNRPVVDGSSRSS